MADAEKQLDLGRRRLLAAATAGCLIPFMPGCSQQRRFKSKPALRFLSASTRKEHLYSVSGIDSSGQNAFSIPSGMRYHSGAFHPLDTSTAVIFSRRPGTHLLIVDTLKGSLINTLQCPDNRHFYGHGCFSRDGAYLYTTENNYDNGVGVIGVWDGKDYSRLGEMNSYGIGPHDIHLLSDNKTLVIASGGIRTHPDYQRRKLNLDSMQAALVYMDAVKGILINRVEISNRSLSIRHLALTDDDKVLIAMQYEGPQTHIVPLVGVQYKDNPIELMYAPEDVLREMRQYTASICMHPQRGIIGVTCPRGNIVTFWQLATQKWVTTLAIKDAGGIALNQTNNHFVITTGSGKVIQVDPVNFEQRLLYVDNNLGWDNHLISPT